MKEGVSYCFDLIWFIVFVSCASRQTGDGSRGLEKGRGTGQGMPHEHTSKSEEKGRKL